MMSSPPDNDDDDEDDRLSLAILRIVSTLTRTSSLSWTDMNSPSIAPIVRTSDQRRWSFSTPPPETTTSAAVAAMASVEMAVNRASSARDEL